ncbi:IS21 family transposase [Endozoicomonas sp. SM1973]|uniref:IS21 family transposase n=1 Tax=Spartinivicinus marinus TaxID=2994442 RepID=A0A853ILH5_9GAMM|nr:IS21 family transposase [Spartinivicinus marinus]MCX4024613.1 IS21 family transposase [Spartinivicinus marinus]MCX4025819.1 IS21 family transposase [Spartinivicinus marinus]MCX4026029.1 IS21 family transposase [Spartinivicinus marinus]MCX4027357.1 IS21 family transposase [Spartinivicinus marinus]MCX4028072.1 IS21 family transposase [Spartinivicinus marinus]
MLCQEDYHMIIHLHRQGIYQKDIAKRVGCCERTVRRVLQQGGSPPSKSRKPKPSKLDPYKPTIDRLLQEDVWNAVVIFREIVALGYDGSTSLLRAYITPKRPLRKTKATVRFETPPGKQLQHDWGEIETLIAGQVKKIYFSVNTLGYSRRFYFWATECMDAEHTLESLILSFQWFGGIPQEVLVDNQKALVLAHSPGGHVRFNPRFLDMASHYDFMPKACRPRRPQTKGKDERMVGYIKHHFFQRYRQFDSLDHLNQQAQQWLQTEADQRIHGTYKAPVMERFHQEQTALIPLPMQRYDTSYRESRLVNWDGYIDVSGNRYSVPDSEVGKQVIIRISLDGELRIYDGENHQLLTRHLLQPIQQGWQTQADHHRALWAQCTVEQRSLAIYQEVIDEPLPTI